MESETQILGINISKQNKKDILSKIDSILISDSKKYIVTPNPEFILAAQKDTKFRKILNKADIKIPDGIGLIWAAEFLSKETSSILLIKIIQISWYFVITLFSIIFYPKYIYNIIPERITGSDLIWDIIKIAEKKNKSIYLLGAKKGIAKKSADVIKNKFPDIIITGAQSGGYPIEQNTDKILNELNNRKPDILFVALGAPKQEKWINDNLSKIQSIKLAIGIGGALDFISGRIKRAPKFFRIFGLEWLYRLIKEPKRIKRIINAIITFPIKIYIHKLKSSHESNKS